VKIASYNQHRSAPLFRALVVEQLPSLLGRRSRRRHLISHEWVAGKRVSTVFCPTKGNKIHTHKTDVCGTRTLVFPDETYLGRSVVVLNRI